MKNIIFTTLLFLGYLNFGLCQNIIDTIYFDDGGIDSYTKSTDASTNFGTDTSLRVFWDYGSPSINNYSYLKADFSSIPESAIVSDASIHIYAVEVNNGADHAMLLQRVSTSWTETGITWTSSPTVTGTAVTMTNAATSELGWQSYNMTEIVRYQITNPAQNYGYRIALSAQSGTIDKGAIYASTENSNSTIRPYVIVEYYIPPHDTIYFQSSKDAKVYSGSTTTNYGQDSLLAVDWTYDSSGTASRTFLYADLSHIPKNSLISTADIHVNALSVNNSASHPMYVEGVNTTPWFEDTVTWSNQPTVWSSYRSGISDASTSSVGWHEMSIISLAKYAVWLPEKNYGWRIALQSESDTISNGVTYASSEHDSIELRPYLVIEYLPPIEIEAYVTHCSEGNDDGSIEVASIIGGCELYTSYYWKKLSGGSLTAVETGTDLSLMDVSGLADGLYLLEITDYRNQIGYKYFFVGEENVTTSVEFAHTNSPNRAKYTEDSWLIAYQSGDSSLVGGSVTSFSCHTNTTYNSRGLLQYQVDWDPSLDFLTCDQTVKNKGGCYQTATSDNDAWISRVTEPWGEFYATWGTRPDLTNEDRVYIPTTVTNGTENRNDTFNILAFVPYWQENPGENYGFDLGLNSYSQAASASRDYSSSDYIGHNLMVSFTVRPGTETTFIDSLDAGTILVNAPAGPLPFTYIISYDTLPDLADMWDYVKDSVDIDSTTFFRGKDNTRNYTFTDLPAEHYFIAVYDNNGDKIMEREVLLTSAIALVEDITMDNDTLKVEAGQTSGSGTINANIKKNESGSFEFEYEQRGDIVVGFNYQDDAMARATIDFEYSIELDSSAKVFYVMKSDSILFTDTLMLNDIFRVSKENFEFVVYRNEFEMHRHQIQEVLTDDFKVDVFFKTAVGVISQAAKVGKVKTPKPIGSIVNNTECGQENGGITMSFVYTSYYSGVTGGTYNIRLVLSGASVESGTFTYPNPVTEFLPAGNYKVEFTSTGSPAISWTEYFTIGQPILWDLLDAYYTPIGSIITTNSNTQTAFALSQNILPAEDTTGFVLFKLGTKHHYMPWGGPFTISDFVNSTVRIVESDEDLVIKLRAFSMGLNIITKYIEVFDETDALVNAAFSINTEGPFKITLEDDTLKVFYNNSPTEFAFVEQGTPDDYRVLASSFCAYVKDPFASFCYGSTTSEQCAELDYELDGNYYVTNNGFFCFVYNEEYNDSTITFNIYNRSNSIIATQDDFGLAETSFLENRIVLDLTTNGFCIGKGYFVLEVINAKNEKFYLRIYNNYNGCIASFPDAHGF